MEDSHTGRGFTDHEMLNRTGFVHMNGRVFDPRLGRFVQPDPVVGNPSVGESYNRYAYVRNSPLSAVDPTGFTVEPREDGGIDITINVLIGFGGYGGYSSSPHRSVASRHPTGGGGGRPGILKNLPNVIAGAWDIYACVRFNICWGGNMPSVPGMPGGGGFGTGYCGEFGGPYCFSLDNRNSQTEAGLPSDFAVGVFSYPRGVFRYFQQERRRLGYLGQGEQVQAILEDRLLLEILGEILERPNTAGRLGWEAAKNSPGRVVGRFAAAQVATRFLQKRLGRLAGTGAGVSFTVLAVGGDIETAVQVLSSQLRISAWTVDPRRPILPQLAGEDVDLLVDSVADIIESAILGDAQ